jgi:hypothetical protein
LYRFRANFLNRVVLLLAGGPPLAAASVVGLSKAIFGFIAPLWDVNANSLRQSVTPQRLIGRVSAASGFVGMATALMGMDRRDHRAAHRAAHRGLHHVGCRRLPVEFATSAPAHAACPGPRRGVIDCQSSATSGQRRPVIAHPLRSEDV